MNHIIESLYKIKQEKEDNIKVAQYELSSTEESLREELYKETRMLNQVLKHNIVEIINMIHKRKLKCSSIRNAETIWHDTVYVVSDGTYFANIIAKDGRIVMDLTGIDNDGCGNFLYRMVKTLIEFDIEPFCEKEKMKYKKD